LRSTAGHSSPKLDAEPSSLSLDMEVTLDPPLARDNISFTQTTSMTLEGIVESGVMAGSVPSKLTSPSDLGLTPEGPENTNQANTMTLTP